MKKLSLLLVLVLLLAGCGAPSPSPTEGQSAPVELVSLDIYAINDLHGKVADTDYQPGVDELTAYLKAARQTGNTLLLSTGDMWQGTSESNLTGGFLVTEWMNELDFSAMVLGGHEYDWGEDRIRQNRDIAEFPFLGINIYDRQTDRQVDYCQSSLMVEVEGAQIGIIGAIGDCYNSITPEHSRDVYFKTGRELTDLVKAEAEALRSRGADFIIYAIHDGYTKNTDQPLSVSDGDLRDYYDISLSEGYVDLVFEADTHFYYTLKDPHGVYHLQSGGNNSGISHAGVIIDLTNGTAFVHTAENVANAKYRNGPEDPAVAQLMEKYSGQIAPATRLLGSNGYYRSGSDICRLVAELYCQKGVALWGDRYDIVLGGGYISCRSPGYLPSGEVSYSQLQSLLPFDNRITLCSIRGSDLVSRFLETDNDAYYIQTTPYGDSIRDSIDPNGTYYVVTDSYSADYAYNNMTVIESCADGLYARDLLAEYIAQGNLE